MNPGKHKTAARTASALPDASADDEEVRTAPETGTITPERFDYAAKVGFMGTIKFTAGVERCRRGERELSA